MAMAAVRIALRWKMDSLARRLGRAVSRHAAQFVGMVNGSAMKVAMMGMMFRVTDAQGVALLSVDTAAAVVMRTRPTSAPVFVAMVHWLGLKIATMEMQTTVMVAAATVL